MNMLKKNPTISASSGFQSKNSCVNQLLLIAHNLYKGFDA